MKRAQGSKNVEPIVCLNPVKGLWRVRMDITETDDGAEWLEHDFDHRPTANELRRLYDEYTNSQVKDKILNGMTYDGTRIYLSDENQRNFLSAFFVPAEFKVGEDDEGNAVYKKFTILTKLTAFKTAVFTHIQQCLKEGWEKKDGFDVRPYLRE